jgi:hypothetical protein
MQWTKLKFGEWMPDQPDFENAGATVATNCYAGATSYKPLKQLAEYGDEMATSSSDFVRGAISIKDSTNTARVYAGDAGTLYRLSAQSFDAIATGFTGTATDNVWNFANYGTDRLLATNFNNNIRKIVHGGSVSELGGSPPRAKYIQTVRDFVVLAWINDGSDKPNRVQWSGYNDSETWVAGDIARQSDFQDIYEGGWISGIAETGGNCLIIQEDAVTLMQYVGPPLVWSFTRIANSVGSRTPRSIIRHADRVWWWGTNEIWEYAGGQIKPIAGEKISDFWANDFNPEYKERVSCAIDRTHKLVMWSYPSNTATGGLPNRLIIYAWDIGRWTYAEVIGDTLHHHLSAGKTLEEMDAISNDVDTSTWTLSFDHPVWKGGDISQGIFKNKKLHLFSGDNMKATIDTGEFKAPTGKTMEIINARPLHEGGDAAIAIGTRSVQHQSATYTTAAGVNRFGEINMRTSGKFVRGRMEISGNWSQAIGLELQMRGSADRKKGAE